jgi:hypothetical protein
MRRVRTMSKGDTVQAMKKPAPKAAQNCVHRPVELHCRSKNTVESATTTTCSEGRIWKRTCRHNARLGNQ